MPDDLTDPSGTAADAAPESRPRPAPAPVPRRRTAAAPAAPAGPAADAEPAADPDAATIAARMQELEDRLAAEAAESAVASAVAEPTATARVAPAKVARTNAPPPVKVATSTPRPPVRVAGATPTPAAPVAAPEPVPAPEPVAVSTPEVPAEVLPEVMTEEPAEEPAEAPVEEPAEVAAPATKAPAKKASAKKAPAKKAPTKKAPAKKAPAKKAPAKTSPALPSSSDRSAELAERADAGVTEDPSREVGGGGAPARPDTVFAAPIAAPARTKATRRKAKAPELEAAPAAPAAAEGARASRWGVWTAVLAVVLLLAAAAGLGTAAVVKNRAPVWESTATVRLLPGPASSVSEALALSDGQQRYVEKVRNADFTGAAALKAGMPDSEIAKTVTATPGKDGTLVLVVSATTDKGAIALANASALTLVDTVASNEKQVTAAPGDRLGAAPVGPSLSATRTTPTNASIALAGILAAAAVLLVSAVLLSRTGSKKR